MYILLVIMTKWYSKIKQLSKIFQEETWNPFKQNLIRKRLLCHKTNSQLMMAFSEVYIIIYALRIRN